MYEEVSSFYKKIKDDKNHRFKSWEHCYSFFQSNEKKNLDLAALNLGFYLASWGMYRGSSFLLQKDYKVHNGAIVIIQEEQYDILHGISLEDLHNNIDKLFDLIKRLRIYYNGIKGDKRDATYTLITKVLMGTLGCIPAYDRFFIEGIAENPTNLSKTLNKENFKALLEWCKKNPIPKSIVEEISTEIEYPIMKIIDMYFWRKGEKILVKKRNIRFK